MTAETRNCPMCGAPASTDSSQCDHCRARLATVACPSCFAMVFAGAKFCSRCGASVARAEIPSDAPMTCPRCRTALSSVAIASVPLRECPRCQGLWADSQTLRQICNDRERQAAVLGLPGTVKADWTGDVERKIRYVPCPVCQDLMNRVNFSRCSQVVVDVCAKHGTWFDKDELRRVVEFIRAGGLDQARELELRELERRRRELAAARAGAMGDTTALPSPSYEGAGLGVKILASVLDAVLE